MRELCEGGEFFDRLAEGSISPAASPSSLGLPSSAEGSGSPSSPTSAALIWFEQMVSAVAHCHAHGAAHGQLHPENVLLHNDRLQLAGFESVTRPVGTPIGVDFGSPATTTTDLSRPSASEVRYALRPRSAFDAPELAGRSSASARELASSDVWALGKMLGCLLTGKRDLELQQLEAQVCASCFLPPASHLSCIS